MGVITVFVEMLKGEQQSSGQPTSRAPGFHGKAVDRPLQAPQELLRALCEAAAMYRDDHIAGMSAGGTLRYELKNIIAFVPGPYLDQVAFAKQPLKVRVANAKAALVPVFAMHGYIDVSGLKDWQVRKKVDSTGQIDDGFVDAFVAQPSSGIGVEFAFDGAFVTDEDRGVDHEGQPKGPSRKSSQNSEQPARVEYRLLDDAGRQLNAGVISEFPATFGRDLSSVNVPDNLSLVSGPHVEFSLTAEGQVYVKDLGSRGLGSTNGTWLILGGRSTKLAGSVSLPRTGKLILGAEKLKPKVAVVEFTNLCLSAAHTATDIASHGKTEYAGEPADNLSPAKATKMVRGGATTTKLSTGSHGGRFGVLVLKYSNGDEEIQPIDKLPFTIGREPQAVGGQIAVVRATCEKVSRNHVRIEDTGKNGLHARVLPKASDGSFLGSRRQEDGFFWSFSPPDDSNAEWLRLGGEVLDRETVWGRIHAASDK